MVTLIQLPRYIALLKKYSSKPTLTHWHKKDGDRVEKGQPLVVIETSKASLEMDAEASGCIVILRQVGEKVQIGDTLGLIFDNRETVKDLIARLSNYSWPG
ncbi:MAG: hypothetical protein HY892_15365 [Deltaproteobacteria bacterium]|nr:hypothetical protein [Deltaproteobacteria bacterium]